MAGDHPIEAHEFQIENLQDRVSDLEGQMQDLLSFKARSEIEVKTIFRVLEEVKAMLKEYTVEMKGALAELTLQFNTKMGKVEEDVNKLRREPGEVAKIRWETMLREGLKYAIILGLGYLVGGKIK